ncbi:hypothetical protein SAMN04487906_2507 [Zhouia amylolytica]|uniref:Uncharacterized protein n=1 Tax=Zhouia amylolytica TaxID=376730 RepID=A0A1I6UIV2_9FLAO|nr:hypothetical protein [Zhouia amylolytica]MCQ0112739.1 hypothetical protein [Zhouia amylolytica]SFT01389.1 hypothetical protein SAMN04487906_2507 [Zhouia amylolytica]
MSEKNKGKYKKLVLGIVLDLIGMLSFVIPGIGEFSDIIWAPMSGWIMTRLYKGRAGQVGGVVSFVEELVPGLDIIPTFTIMWFYTYVFKREDSAKDKLADAK